MSLKDISKITDKKVLKPGQKINLKNISDKPHPMKGVGKQFRPT